MVLPALGGSGSEEQKKAAERLAGLDGLSVAK
jgi:hypothetical protein